MIFHALNGAFERLARADEQIVDLRARVDAWLLHQEDAVRFSFDLNPPHNGIVDTSKCIGPPVIVGMIIG